MTISNISQKSTSSEKIAFFRSLFKGREDLYPQRFENRKTGKAGYSPACGNEWVRGICEKPKIKCSECRHRCFLPINENVVRWHLLGHDDSGKDFVMGIYPMLLNETCFFLAADFDKSTWQEDAKGFLKTCRDLNIPAAIERSRSGRGAHVWLFFSEAIPAVLARKLGCHILTETMEHNPDIGLDSYDRFFPNQDTLPQGGFGNLIALRLQKKARDQENSVFVNEDLIAYEDQLIRLAAFPNPEFYKAQAMRLPTYETPRLISCSADYPDHIGNPQRVF